MGNKHTPEIQLSGFSGDWEERELGDIYGKIKNAFVGTATPYYVDKGNFYLQSNNVKNGQINRNTEVYINDEFYEKQKDNWLHTDDLVMVQSGHVGHTAVIPDELDKTAAHALIIFSNYQKDTDPYFLNYQFQTFTSKKKLDNISTGNTVKHILASEMKKFLVEIPKYEEQKGIGDFFKLIDDAIALQQQELITLKQTKQGFLQKMFPKEGESLPEVRFPGFSGDWEQCKLKEIVDLLKDGTHGTHKVGKGAFLLSAKNIKNGQIVIDELTDRKISSDDYNSIFKNYKLMDQDLLITIVGTIGQTALYTETTFKLAFQRSVAIIRGNEDINQNFLKSQIDSNFVQKQLKRSASMSAQAGVYLGDLGKLTLNIPKLSEQIKIGNFFKQVDDTIALHKQELDTLKQTKKAFLQKMFI